ncbi:acyltransferase family protein [Streptomyces sp. SP18CS02]|uniref:acyltransferase family protein n=1 Tax=Streptomyces sp. SP18CS02 TaxID=3002531 RepID=UPI002E77AC84|nr:acyltransferase [Streptomyces sp. SP18CS02]MEE1754915.1 acyltransferase [Streptomyces sp. SP18CS02]
MRAAIQEAPPAPAPAARAERPQVPLLGGQLPSLTGMRWAAAFLVFLYHIKNFRYFGAEDHPLVNWAFGPGTVGVTFFFVLSGFVLAWSARPGDKVTSFWRRRLARVYPVHVVTALIALALAFSVLPALKPSGYKETAANLLLLSSWKIEWWQAVNPVSWSLVCEAFFYATFPAVYAVLRRFGPRALTALVVVSIATVMVLPKVNALLDTGVVLYSFPAARIPEFVLGIALARLVQLGHWRGPGLEAATAITLIGYFMYPHFTHAFASTTVLGFALMIPAGAVADIKGTPSMWRNRRLVKLGEWSFAFYMIHVLVLQTASLVLGSKPRFDTLPALGATAAVFAVALALAAALYHGVELPGRRLLLGKRRPIRSKGAQADSPPGTAAVPGPPERGADAEAATPAARRH